MGLTKRLDGYYVEMRVIDDGKTLRRATKEQGGLPQDDDSLVVHQAYPDALDCQLDHRK